MASAARARGGGEVGSVAAYRSVHKATLKSALILTEVCALSASVPQMSHAQRVASPHRTTPSSLVSVKLKVATEDDRSTAPGTLMFRAQRPPQVVV